MRVLVSPELALVDEELREVARADLPAIAPDEFLAPILPGASASNAPLGNAFDVAAATLETWDELLVAGGDKGGRA